MNPSLKDQLKEWKCQHPETTPKKKPHQKTQKRKSEHLSDSDIRDMDKRPMHRGRGGAWRNSR